MEDRAITSSRAHPLRERLGRRRFTALLGGAALWPGVARPNPRATPAIGFLNPASARPFAPYTNAFLGGLEEAGYSPTRNVAIDYRWADGRYDRLPSLAGELIRRDVAVIAAMSEPAALAVKAAAGTRPVVFLIGGDPVRLGFVASLSRPGANMTGVTQFTFDLEAKRFDLLHELVPAARVVAALVNPNFPAPPEKLKDWRQGAAALGLELHVLAASTVAEIDAAFAEMARRRVGALLVGADPFFNSRRAQLAALAARHKLPAVYEFREFADAGGLMSYGTNIADMYRQAGGYVGRILGGALPASLPVLQPTKFELVVNLKAARALGLAMPPALLTRADEVIE